MKEKIPKFQDNTEDKLPNSGPTWEKKFGGSDEDGPKKESWGKGRLPDRHVLEFFEKYNLEGKKIIDIGSGDGRHLIDLAKKGYDVTGLELTKAGIKRTREKQSEEGTGAKLVRGNFHNLPFIDNSYDAAISVQAMQHNNWRGAEAAISEAARVLKPGGLFFLRVSSDKNVLRGEEKIIEDKGLTWARDENGTLGIHHSFSFEELKELADKYDLDIEPGYVDEKAAGENFIMLGQWNIVFRKKADNSGI